MPSIARRPWATRGALAGTVIAAIAVVSLVAGHEAAGQAPATRTGQSPVAATTALPSPTPSSATPAAAATSSAPSASTSSPTGASSVTASASAAASGAGPASATARATATGVSSSLVAPSPATAAGLPVAAQLTLPANDFAVGAPTEFSVVLTNHTAKTYSSLAPMLQLITPAGAPLKGTLERFDPAASAWRAIPIPGIDTAPIGAAGPTPFTLASNASLTIRYRLTVSPDQPAERTDAMFYAIGSDGHQIGLGSGAFRTAGH